MRTLLVFCICMAFCSFLLGQQKQKPRYDCYEDRIKQGRDYAKDPKTFKLALQKFNAARRCDPSRSDSVDVEINKLFTLIVGLKDESDKNKRKLEVASTILQEKNKAINITLELLKQEKAKTDISKQEAMHLAGHLLEKNKELEKTLTQVKHEQEKNKRIIDAFYFYGDSLALAVKQNDFGIYKYGFINKEGEIMIEHQYEEASLFNQYDGFARVKQENGNYLLDVNKNLYLLAQTVNEINSKTKALDLHQTNLNSIPSDVFQKYQLEVLLVYKNKLKNLPDNINNLTNLKILDLSYNDQIKAIPRLDQLINLQQLDLSYNKGLEYFPNEIKKLSNLKELYLGYTLIKELPVDIGELKKLKTLYLRGNKNLKISKNIIGLDSLEVFYLREHISGIPKEIYKLKKIKFLDFSYCKLNNIDYEIEKLENLQSLNLSGNKELKIFPSVICNLANLNDLYLIKTDLESLPKEIENLKQLKNLDLKYNYKLKQLPKEIENLKQLKNLDLRGCPIPIAERTKIQSWLPNCQIVF